MILIFQITSEGGLERFRQSLENISQNLQPDSDILCITNDEALYPKVQQVLRDGLELATAGQTLVVFSPSRSLWDDAKGFINIRDDKVLLWNEGCILPLNALRNLEIAYMLAPHAGFIAGDFTAYDPIYWIKDLYADRIEYVKRSERPEAKESKGSLMEVDASEFYGLLTQYKEFRDFSFSGRENPALEYGIYLRKSGYQNYVDVDLKLEREKNE